MVAGIGSAITLSKGTLASGTMVAPDTLTATPMSFTKGLYRLGYR